MKAAARNSLADPATAGVDASVWRSATASCHPLRVARVIRETADCISIALEPPAGLEETFRCEAGQFLSFKIPHAGQVLVRSYSVSSAPGVDAELRVTVKRVAGGRVSNLLNDRVCAGATLLATPPAGRFVLRAHGSERLTFFCAGSGITPCISLIKTCLAKGSQTLKLVYANQDAGAIIFGRELEALRSAHAERLEIVHSLDDRDGWLDVEGVRKHAGERLAGEFYLCGPAPFMDLVEQTLGALGVDPRRIHIERFISPPDTLDHGDRDAAAGASDAAAPESITLVLDGQTYEVPYTAGERVISAARRAGLEPPFSCEEGYCSTCMATLVRGEVVMAENDCLSPELLAEGWILTCQARCVSREVRIEYPDA
jgi:3-ketosteroid 9alpha-monooxygenase subunit B